jgi:hypothetical protein
VGALSLPEYSILQLAKAETPGWNKGRSSVNQVRKKAARRRGTRVVGRASCRLALTAAREGFVGWRPSAKPASQESTPRRPRSAPRKTIVPMASAAVTVLTIGGHGYALPGC